jgi:hypothetical protein
MAFTQNTNPTFPKQPQNTKVQITHSTGTASVTGYTAGSSGSKIIAIIVTNTDTNPYSVQTSITNGTVYLLGTKSVPTSAGNVAGTPATNLLDPTVMVGMPLDSDGNPFLYLISGDTLTFASLSTVTTAQTLNITVLAVDF